jgi:hypothetical protein
MGIEDKFLLVTMLDGSKWKIPVRVIAEYRARYYLERCEFKSLEESLEKDTIPLFEEDEYEVEDWASNNMDWSDVEKYAIQVRSNKLSYEDSQEGWINGEKEIIE